MGIRPGAGVALPDNMSASYKHALATQPQQPRRQLPRPQARRVERVGRRRGGVRSAAEQLAARQIAIAAAESVIGTTYVFASADPNVGIELLGARDVVLRAGRDLAATLVRGDVDSMLPAPVRARASWCWGTCCSSTHR